MWTQNTAPCPVFFNEPDRSGNSNKGLQNSTNGQIFNIAESSQKGCEMFKILFMKYFHVYSIARWLCCILKVP